MIAYYFTTATEIIIIEYFRGSVEFNWNTRPSLISKWKKNDGGETLCINYSKGNHDSFSKSGNTTYLQLSKDMYPEIVQLCEPKSRCRRANYSNYTRKFDRQAASIKVAPRTAILKTNVKRTSLICIRSSELASLLALFNNFSFHPFPSWLTGSLPGRSTSSKSILPGCLPSWLRSFRVLPRAVDSPPSKPLPPSVSLKPSRL